MEEAKRQIAEAPHRLTEKLRPLLFEFVDDENEKGNPEQVVPHRGIVVPNT